MHRRDTSGPEEKIALPERNLFSPFLCVLSLSVVIAIFKMTYQEQETVRDDPALKEILKRLHN